MGASLGSRKGEAGTLGFFLRKRDRTREDGAGYRYFITAAHVVGTRAKRGDRLTVPAIADAQSPPDARDVGVVHFIDQYSDLAVGELAPGVVGRNTIAGEVEDVATVRDPALDEDLVKFGRTTCLTAGRVDCAAKLFGVGICAIVRSHVPSREAPAIVKRGDSGAVWVSRRDGAAVAMHLYGEAGAVGGENVSIALLLHGHLKDAKLTP
jgi:hypothetical protein